MLQPLRKAPAKFTKTQVLELEKQFHFNKYLCPLRRIKIAASLNLTKKQVSGWFKNRRTKYRRQSMMTKNGGEKTDLEDLIRKVLLPCSSTERLLSFDSEFGHWNYSPEVNATDAATPRKGSLAVVVGDLKSPNANSFFFSPPTEKIMHNMSSIGSERSQTIGGNEMKGSQGVYESITYGHLPATTGCGTGHRKLAQSCPMDTTIPFCNSPCNISCTPAASSTHCTSPGDGVYQLTAQHCPPNHMSSSSSYLSRMHSYFSAVPYPTNPNGLLTYGQSSHSGLSLNVGHGSYCYHTPPSTPCQQQSYQHMSHESSCQLQHRSMSHSQTASQLRNSASINSHLVHTTQPRNSSHNPPTSRSPYPYYIESIQPQTPSHNTNNAYMPDYRGEMNTSYNFNCNYNNLHANNGYDSSVGLTGEQYVPNSINPDGSVSYCYPHHNNSNCGYRSDSFDENGSQTIYYDLSNWK